MGNKQIDKSLPKQQLREQLKRIGRVEDEIDERVAQLREQDRMDLLWLLRGAEKMIKQRELIDLIK